MALSPLNKRRLANFRANKRGFWSLWIFLTLFGLSLFADHALYDWRLCGTRGNTVDTDTFFRMIGSQCKRQRQYRDPR